MPDARAATLAGTPNATAPNTPIPIAVRALVETVLRSGDLAAGFWGGHDTTEAVRAHQHLQRQRPVGYKPELAVQQRLVVEAHTLELTGRIDGVYTDRDPAVVEEIKTTYGDLPDDAIHLQQRHWGQLRCYAFLYARQQGLSKIGLQLTYCRLPQQTTRTFQRWESLERLESFCRRLITRYLQGRVARQKWQQTRNRSIRTMGFPFAHPRPGQFKMTEAVYRAIESTTPLLVHAPTGIGKTMATIYPALQALGDGHTGKVFYLTARDTGKAAVESALKRMRQQGLRLRSLTLTAKERICPAAGRVCMRDTCPRAKGYFDRLDGAVQEALQTDDWDCQAVSSLARRHSLCPFEFSLELAQWADCILCDYNYVFDPRVRLRRFFTGSQNDYTLLVDEVHNLLERAREMFSAEIQKNPLLQLRLSIKSRWPKICQRITNINTRLLQLRRQCEPNGTHVSLTPPEDLLPLLGQFLQSTRKAMQSVTLHERDLQLEEIAWRAFGFLQIAECYDDAYATLCEKDGADLRVKLFCRNCADALKRIYAKCRTAIFFSATATPAPYFQQSLGCENDSDVLTLPAVFPAENLCVLVADRVSTLYRHRSQTRFKVAGMIHSLVTSQPGNYLIFLPSYAYLEIVAHALREIDPSLDLMVQHPRMSAVRREDFLACFNQPRNDTLVGFAVAGGIFGEGIDLVGERLTGAVVVGIGLPGISPERELLRNYYDHNEGQGFAHAYLYPGLTRVMQAAGRVIRSDNDRGVVLLIDHRFARNDIQEVLPGHWQMQPVRTSDDIRRKLQHFWSK